MMTAEAPPALDTIHNGDCLELFAKLKTGSIDLVFADPPFNIGYEYDQYHDRQSDNDYIGWTKRWMGEVFRTLKPSGTFWLAIGDEYAADLKVLAERELGFTTRSWVIWYYTFGVNCSRKFSRSHAHIFHFVKDPNNFTFNAEDPFIRVPSARALVYGDKRANPNGRLPDDTWILRPQDLAEGFQPMDDTWYFARVAGTFKERQGFHGCQMPEQLLGRIIRVSSNENDIVLDPFSGSGTTLAVAKKEKRHWLGFELSADYVKFASERLETAWPGAPLDGPRDAVGSAPTTANGRRLKAQPLLPGFVADDFPEPIPVIGEEADEIIEPESIAAASAEDTPQKRAATAKVEAKNIDLRELIDRTILNAFASACKGKSIQAFLAGPSLQTSFHQACRDAGLLGTPADWNGAVLRLSRSVKLKAAKKTTLPSTEALDEVSFAGEIAWRQASDKFAGTSLEEILCDPEKAAYFDKTAKKLLPGCDVEKVRRAALQLQKSLPRWDKDAKDYHYVLATRDFHDFQTCKSSLKKLKGKPGLYLLRGEKKKPLYVGETLDLGRRLEAHRAGKADGVKQFSVILQDELPSADYRQPLKVALVKRYGTVWNVQ